MEPEDVSFKLIVSLETSLDRALSSLIQQLTDLYISFSSLNFTMSMETKHLQAKSISLTYAYHSDSNIDDRAMAFQPCRVYVR